MKILITGCAGEWGARIATDLVNHGHDVWGIDNLRTGTRDSLPAGITFMLADITDPIGLPSCDVIVHTAPEGIDRVTAHAAREHAILINLQ